MAGDHRGDEEYRPCLAQGCKHGGRMGDWIELVGWGRFFELMGMPFTNKQIGDFIFSIPTFRSVTLFTYTDTAAAK